VNNQGGSGDLNVVHATSLARIKDRGGPRRGPEQGLLDIVPDGAVAVRDGVIVSVGTTEKVLGEVGPALTIDAEGKTVIPGLVEAHSHPLFAGTRAQEYVARIRGVPRAEILASGGGIMAAVTATRAAADQTLLSNASKAYQRFLRAGVTTLEVKSGYGLTTSEELRALRLLAESAHRTPIDLVITFLGAHTVPTGGTTPEEFSSLVADEMLPAVISQAIAQFHDVVCENGEFEAALAARLLGRSRELGMPTRVHADASSRSEGWATAVDGGAVTADHLTYTDVEDVRTVGETTTIAVLLPVAEQIYMDTQAAPARALIESNVPVAIAGDYCSSLQVASPLLAMATATWRFRMTPAEALVGSTLNASYALLRGHDRGSLDVGKRGDLVVLDVERPDELAISPGTPLVRHVISAGRVVFGEPALHPGVHQAAKPSGPRQN